MRNLIWTGAAAALVIMAGFFVAVRHAARHPDSLLVRGSLAFYHLCDELLSPHRHARATQEIAQAPQAPAVPPMMQTPPVPVAEVLEPIVIEPTDREPPLASPRLSPEIAAAIERLRSEEESEAPPVGFDEPAQALRMPYADEDVEELPVPVRDEPQDSVAGSSWQPELTQLLLLAPSYWQTFVDRLMEVVGQDAN